MNELKNYTLPKGKVLVFKSVKNDMTAYGGFKWPESGSVEAPDWKNNNECGHGLHGWLWGCGDYSLQCSASDAKWLILEVDEVGIVELNGKVKFKQANVIYCGKYAPGFNFIRKLYWKKFIVEKPTKDVSATSGYSAHSATSGDYAHSATSGNSAHSATSGNSAHSATSGDYAHSATSGNKSISCCLGTETKAKCGKDGSIILTYWDEKLERYRHVVGYEGEDGIKKDTWYEVVKGKLKKCKDQNIKW